MNTLRKFLFAAIGGLLWVAPTYGQNNQSAGGARPPARAELADGTLGMALMAAVVNSNGTLARGSGVVSSLRLFPGQYEVIFDRNVTACFYVATRGQVGSVGIVSPGVIDVAGRNGNANGVFVNGSSLGGVQTDVSFHLQVFCAR